MTENFKTCENSAFLNIGRFFKTDSIQAGQVFTCELSVKIFPLIQEEMPVGLRSSPDSSTDPWGCPQCGQGAENESKLLEHLLQEHKIRVVPPQSPTKTRCPVCRKHVADLSHHFALEHGDQQQSQEITPQGLLSGGGASVTRIIPIVLPSQPGKICNTRRNTPNTKLEATYS